MARLGNSYAGMMVGIFFFFIIATEIFINFKINFRPREKELSNPSGTDAGQGGAAGMTNVDKKQEGPV